MARLGIIAGGGGLPVKLVEACKRSGRDYFVLALHGQADADVVQNSSHDWVHIGATNRAMEILRDKGVDQVVLAGSIRRPWLLSIRPDLRTLKVLIRLGRKVLGDDVMLRAVARELEKEGFKVVGAHEIEPGLITPEGILGKKQPTAEDTKDILLGIETSKQLGKFDVGQAAIVRHGHVVGTETAQGTDALLRQCRNLTAKGAAGGVLVKSCKPQQDKRMDLPAIGPGTIQKAYEAGLAGIAIEAGSSILLDKEETIALADRLGLFVIGFKPV